MEMPCWWIPMCVVMGLIVAALYIHQIIRSNNEYKDSNL